MVLAWLVSPLAGSIAPARAAECPAGNLLAGRAPSAWQGIRGDRARPTDGVAANEGALWNLPLATQLAGETASLTWDLGVGLPITTVWIQADANDEYTIEGSDDGRSFRVLGRIDVMEGHGLQGRVLRVPPTSLRFVRVGEGQGDGFYSISEVQVFCQEPPLPPPALRRETSATAASADRSLFVWNDETSARWELILAGLGLALLRWGVMLRRQGRTEYRRKLRERLLAALGVLAALTYINFGSFHFGNFLHDWEWTHYYVGAKYFPELEYTRLYDCLATADVEDGLRRRVERRKMTDLRTNLLISSADILAHPERCKERFTPERWAAFRHDARYFRERQSVRRWEDLHTDHGYNATPTWNVAGHWLSNLSPASRTQVGMLAALDPIYLAGTLVVTWWAFGWRALAIALLVFATNFPGRFYWTGGSFLRWDWLFYLVAGIALLKKDRPALAGAALTYAALLRVFPLFVFIGPAAAVIIDLYKHRRVDLRWRRFFAGAAIAGVLLVGISLGVSGGIRGHGLFIENTIKHKETPLVNHIGLRTVLSWRPSEVSRYTFQEGAFDPWQRWKDARLASFAQGQPLWILALLLGVAAIARAASRPAATPAWVLGALGAAFIPIGVELTSYYTMFVFPVALLAAARAEIGRWLLGLCLFTQFVAWAPLRNMSTASDEQHVLMSAAMVAVFAAILWRCGDRSGDEVFAEPGAGQPPDLDEGRRLVG